MTNIVVNHKKVTDLMLEFCPYSYSDMERCADILFEINEEASWLYEKLQEAAESWNVNMDDLDPVATAYEAVLHEMRKELFDFVDDLDTPIYVNGNHLFTSYECSVEAFEKFNKKLKKLKIKKANLSEKALWFLSSIDN